MTPMRVDFPYLMPDRDRHGSQRVYVRRHGRKVRIREKPGTEAFARAYADALRALDAGPAPSREIAQARTRRHAWLAGRMLFRFYGISRARR